MKFGRHCGNNCDERFQTDVEQKWKRRIWDLENVESIRDGIPMKAGGLKALILYTQHCFAFEGSSWKPPPAALPNFFARFVSENCYFNGLSIQT